MNNKRVWLILAASLAGVLLVVSTVMYFNLKSELEDTQSQAQEYKREIASLEQNVETKDQTIEELQIKVNVLQKETETRGPCAEITEITSQDDPGEYVYHDFHFWNKGYKDLHEVKASINITGDNGKTVSVSKYFALWSVGQKQTVSIAIDQTTRKYQKWSMSGLCNEGNINIAWVPTRK